MGPLKGIRVLDLTRILAGPFATQTLADLGAEVIKLERPGTGDDSRGWGPPYIKDKDGRDTSESTYFAAANRGKKSVSIDLAHPEGQKLTRALAQKCDALVENFKVGDLKRYGLGYDEIRALKPGIIYCSITGYGQTGPYAERPGYDPIAQAMSGLMSVTGEPEDLPGSVPQRVGVAVIDLMTAHYAVIAILAALLHRNETGEGQHIDLGLLDVGVGSMANIASAYLGAGVIAKRNGGVHPSVLPSQVFKCSDGYVIVAAGNDSQFAKLCLAAGFPEIAKDPRFSTNSARLRHRATIVPILESWFAKHSVSHWATVLADAGVPCGPIYAIDQVYADPQVEHLGIVQKVGDIPYLGQPVTLSRTPSRVVAHPPARGEHTADVLRDLGYGDAEIEQLKNHGTV